MPVATGPFKLSSQKGLTELRHQQQLGQWSPACLLGSCGSRPGSFARSASVSQHHALEWLGMRFDIRLIQRPARLVSMPLTAVLNAACSTLHAAADVLTAPAGPSTSVPDKNDFSTVLSRIKNDAAKGTFPVCGLTAPAAPCHCEHQCPTPQQHSPMKSLPS